MKKKGTRDGWALVRVPLAVRERLREMNGFGLDGRQELAAGGPSSVSEPVHGTISRALDVLEWWPAMRASEDSAQVRTLRLPKAAVKIERTSDELRDELRRLDEVTVAAAIAAVRPGVPWPMRMARALECPQGTACGLDRGGKKRSGKQGAGELAGVDRSGPKGTT